MSEKTGIKKKSWNGVASQTVSWYYRSTEILYKKVLDIVTDKR